MLKNSNIVIIRHGEKPKMGIYLSHEGKARAHAYIAYFQNYKVNNKVIPFNHLIVAANSEESHRPYLTLKPLSIELNLPLIDTYKNHEYEELAHELQTNSTYENSNILICWHHGETYHLARALGLNDDELETKIPHHWPDEVFGWNLHIAFDENGNIIHKKVKNHNQQLMYNDHGKDPHKYLS